MRVLQIISSLSTGGAEKLLVESVSIYQKKGVVMDVISLDNTRTVFWECLEKSSTGFVKGLTSKSIYNPLLIFKIIPFFKDYDIVHFHLFPALYWTVIAKYFSNSNVRLIYTEHSTENNRRNHWLFRIIDRLIYNKIDVIICITNAVKNNLFAHLKMNMYIKVINNGIDISKYNISNQSESYDFFSKDDFKLIQVSSFRKQKDQATVIRSLTNLPQRVKLMLVGDGEQINECKNLVNYLQLGDRVIFLGNRYDIPSLIKYSDVVVLSSKSEGFGLAIVEGMASGKPVIASDIPGIREIVKDYGLLFNKSDDVDLAFQIRRLLFDSKFYIENSKKCLMRARDFDIIIMVNRYIEIYNGLYI